MSTIVVMGATGHCGSGVVDGLLQRGHHIRALGRSARRLQPFADVGAEILAGDVADSAYLVEAFNGADRAFMLLPEDPQTPDQQAFEDRVGEATVAALSGSSVTHAVFVSSLGAGGSGARGFVEGLGRQEDRLRAIQGLNVLALRNGWFFENFLASIGLIREQGIDAGVIEPDLPVAMIATADIATATVAALDSADFSGFVVRELLGQRHLTFSEVAGVLGSRIGLPALQYRQLGYEDYTKSLVSAGLSESIASLFTEMGRAFNEGRIRSDEGRTAENTTPTTIEEFAGIFAKQYEGTE